MDTEEQNKQNKIHRKKYINKRRAEISIIKDIY
jgi:hypothetical protein